jgi:hypothetical protein
MKRNTESDKPAWDIQYLPPPAKGDSKKPPTS